MKKNALKLGFLSLFMAGAIFASSTGSIADVAAAHTDELVGDYLSASTTSTDNDLLAAARKVKLKTKTKIRVKVKTISSETI